MKFLFLTLRGLPVFSIICFIMGGSCLHIGQAPFLPAFYLIPTYYWIIFRPQDLPLWSLFFVGLLYDSLMKGELLLSSILLMLSWVFGQHIRPFLIPHSFFFIWGAFAIYSLVYTSLYALFVGGTPLVMLSWIYGVLLYPFITWLLSSLHLRVRLYV
jgi:hypothetical protein